ncbi:MAG: SDR family NAD(P)-dependent oxidoreductase [Erysipelotrichaceae bacterium]
MDLGYKGKTVIITGGTKGIGSGISEVFAQEQANLIIDYRSNKDNSSELFIQSLRDKYGVEVYGIQQDLAEEDCAVKIIDFAYEKFGRIDVLINNAGGSNESSEIQDININDWNNALKNNVTQYYLMGSEFARRLISEHKKGAIVNVLSKASMTTTTKGRACYVTNKTAQLGLTRQMAVDLSQYGIIVNGVMPGSVMNQRMEKRDAQYLAERTKRMPLGKINDPIEIGYYVAWLASEKNQVAVGAAADATGGMLLGF